MTKLLTVLLCTLSINTVVFGKDLFCQTNYSEIKISIIDNQVALLKAFESSRDIASSQRVKTIKTDKGFNKVFYKGSLKYKISIKDLSSLNEVDDYLSVVSSEGHRMTYPLICSN